MPGPSDKKIDPHMKNISVLALVPFVFACSLGGPLREDKSANNYQLPSPGADWMLEKFKEIDADKVYLNKKSSAMISVSSLCGRYDGASLESLMKSAHAPLQSIDVLENQDLILDGRAALRRHIKAKMDGVPVVVLSTVLRKDDCIFDFHLQKAHDISGEDVATYENMLKGFHYGRSEYRHDQSAKK